MAVKTFNEATVFLTVINRVWALRNFTRPKNKIRFFFSWLYNIFVLCLSITTIVYVEFSHYVQFDYKTEGIMYKYLMPFDVIVLIWMSILGWYHSKDFLIFEKLVCKVEEDFQTLGSTFNYQSIFLQVVLFGSFWLCDWIVISTLYVKWMIKNKTLVYILLSVCSYLFGNSIGSIILLDFKTNVFWLGIRFKQINKLLDSILLKNNRKEEDIDTISKSVQNFHNRFGSDPRQLEYYSPQSKIAPENYTFSSTYQPRSTKTIFRKIRFLHQQLCCMTKILSKTFDTQLLLLSGNTVVYVTIVCYYLCIEIRKTMSLQKMEPNLLTVCIIYAFFDFAKICIVTYNCEYTMKQANKTTEIVHKFALCQADTELKEEILQFSLQISHARRGKSKINFFSLNYSFLRACVGFVTTYLIIIIQFSKNSELSRQDSVLNTTSITS